MSADEKTQVGRLTAGAGVLVVLSAAFYLPARLTPEARSEAELEQVRSTRGDRAAERFRQMDEQRTYTVRLGRILFPLSVVLFVVALLVDLVG